MGTVMEAPVVIVGGGPVGFCLALDLAYRGNASVVVEQDAGTATVLLAKAGALNERSMEMCRRWGFADRIAGLGFPDDLSRDTYYCTSLSGKLIGVNYSPSARDRPVPTFSPEKYRNCPQYQVDPLLAEEVRRTGLSRILYGHRFEGLRQDSRGVSAELRDMTTGKKVEIRSQYLVACDGAGSTVREALGIGFPGEPQGISISAMVRIENFERYALFGHAFRYMFIGRHGTWANFSAVDGRALWRLVLMGPEAEANPNPSDEEVAASVRRALGRDDIPFEILRIVRWRRSERIAERYREDRVLLAGDAAHTMSPTGGHGLNTGLGDVFDLGWKLDAKLKEWGGEYLLDAYGAERRPVAIRNGSISSKNWKNWIGGADFNQVLDESAEGDAARERIGRQLNESLKQEWLSQGVVMGYRYEGSSIVVPDGTPEPPDDPSVYEQIARPGHRAPHAWLEPERSVIDLFGRGFVLLCMRGSLLDAGPLLDAARQCGVPVSAVDLDRRDIADVYGSRLALVRPDGHVAWRGDTLPAAVGDLVDTIRGARGK